MDFSKNPLLNSTHEYKLRTIYKRFPGLKKADKTEILSLYDFFNSTPQKYFSQEVFKVYYEFISEMKPERLQMCFKEHVHSLDIAFKSLSRINNENFHDTFHPNDEIDRIRFIDRYIHHNYQRLIEGAYHAFIYPITFDILKSNDKKTENMNVFNCNQVLEKSEKFSIISKFYDHDVRNAIAHNDIEFLEKDIKYRNRKKVKVLHSRSTINLFDKLLDTCNAMAFALKTFVLTNNEFIQENNIQIPKWIIVEEIIPNLNTYEWRVEDIFESTLPDGRNQLIIYGKNSLLSFNEALFYSFQTTILTERFLSGYDRYYISSQSKYAPICFGGFNGKILKENREKGNLNYKGVIEDVLFFVPKFKTPRFFRLLRRLYFTSKTEFKYKYLFRKKSEYQVRWTESHRNVNHSVVKAGVVLTSIDKLPEDIIRENITQIARKTIKNARKNTSLFKRHRYLTVGYLSIFIYQEDRRLREIKNSGLIENLICTVVKKKLKRINSPDIIGSKIETIGNYRIAWNKNSTVFDNV
ncbi:MAG: hypothetical protein COA32_09765 [Fluviicola sp.]|nr:MAG: hypothetical protein COA32_09765 [Fluviicola sp.]